MENKEKNTDLPNVNDLENQQEGNINLEIVDKSLQTKDESVSEIDKQTQERTSDKVSFFSKQYFMSRFNKSYIVPNFKQMWVKYAMFLGIIAMVLIIDLVLKSVFDYKRYDFIEGFISIDGYAHNTGAAFSIFSNATVFLLILSIVCLVGYVIFEFLTMNHRRGYTFYVATALMFGGALGNLIDRVAFGYVRDFIKLEFMDFPIFNIADCALTIGVILLAVWLLFIEGKEKKKNAKDSV